jgi:hypothetical protein
LRPRSLKSNEFSSALFASVSVLMEVLAMFKTSCCLSACVSSL